MTIKEACEKLGISRETLRKWVKQGRIRYTVQINGRYNINEQSVERILNEHKG